MIPGRAEFTIDLRAPTDQELAEADGQFRDAIAATARRRGLEVELEDTESLPAVRSTPISLPASTGRPRGRGSTPLAESVSGALHDAAILAPLVPTVMLFVASRDGISHNPREESRVADIALAARLLHETVREAP